MIEAPQTDRFQKRTSVLGVPDYAGVGDSSDKLVGIGPDLREIVEQTLGLTKKLESTSTWRKIIERELLSANLSRRIAQLSGLPLDDEFGRVRPSPSALGAAQDLVGDADLPVPDDIDTDRDGAIRISWLREEKFLEIVFPIEPQPAFLYWSEGEKFGMDDLTFENVRSRIVWLEGVRRR